jgi:hypothetical protein
MSLYAGSNQLLLSTVIEHHYPVLMHMGLRKIPDKIRYQRLGSHSLKISGDTQHSPHMQSAHGRSQTAIFSAMQKLTTTLFTRHTETSDNSYSAHRIDKTSNICNT